jgi:hypothetical protein
MTACLNSAAMASETPCDGLTSKNSPGDAQLAIFWLIELAKGAIQVVYQLLVGSGR